MTAASQWLIIVFGTSIESTNEVAMQVAAGLPSKTSIVRQSDLEQKWIVTHDDDRIAELDMVYMQIKLLVSHYMRNRYNVVVAGPYLHAQGGEVHSYDEEIDQLRALMRAMPVNSLTVMLYGSEGGPAPADVPSRYGVRSGQGNLKFDLSVVSPAKVAETIVAIARGD